MRRKIIKQGNNSYTVTLPINWIRDERLEEGGEIEINQDDSHLLISIPKDLRRSESPISIDMKGYNERTIRNILNQSYRKGYDAMHIKFTEKKQLDIIRDIVRNTLLGFEVVEENADHCTIQNIAEPSEEKFSIILRKIFLYIKSESEEILEEFKNRKASNLKKREHTKNIIDNYTNLCRRLIIKYKIGGSKDSYLLMLILSRLSLLYHAYYYMYKFAASQRKIAVSNETIVLLQKANHMFDLFYESFYKKDIEKAHQIGVLKNILLHETLYSLFQKSKGMDNVILYHIGEIIRLIHVQSINIFGLTDLDLEYGVNS